MGNHVSPRDIYGYCQIYSAEFPATWQRFVLEQISDVHDTPAARPGGDLTEAALTAAAHQGVSFEALEQAQLAEWLTCQERSELSPREALVRMLVRSYRSRRKTHEFIATRLDSVSRGTAQTNVAESYAINDELASRNSQQTIHHLKSTTLREHLAKVWRVRGDDDGCLLAAARDRGLHSIEEAMEVARRYFLRSHLLTLDSPSLAAEGG